MSYYITPTGYVYSNRLALLIERSGIIEMIKRRLEKYFDEFIIDEIQDISGRDCVHHRNCAAKPAKLSMDSAEIEQRFRVN